MTDTAPTTQPSPSVPASGPVSAPASDSALASLLSRFDAAMEACEVQATDEQRESIHARITELIEQLEQRGMQIFSARSGPLQLRRVRLAGLLPFQQPVSEPYTFDFDRISGQVAAVVGRNGHGKSTLVEAAVGAIFGRTLSRGPLDEIAVSEEAPWQVGADIETASGTWRVERKRGGCAVFEPGSTRPVARGHHAVQSWSRSNVPAPGVLMAGQFGVQRHRGHLLHLEPAPARDVLLSMLGLDVYQAISKAAGERLRIVDADATRHAGRVEELQRAVNESWNAQAQVEQLAQQIEIAREWLARSEDALAVARESATSAQEETSRKRRIASLERDATNAQTMLARIEKQIADVQAMPVPNLDELAQSAEKSRVDVEETRKTIAEVEHRIAYSKDTRLSKLRVALTDVSKAAKQAPSISARALLADNTDAVNAKDDVEMLEILRGHCAAYEDTYELARRMLQQARESMLTRPNTLELAARANEIRADIQRMNDELAELCAVAVVPHDDTRALERAVQDHRASVARIERDMAIAKHRSEQAEQASARLAEQERVAAALTVERHEWFLITDLFGRNGIQGLAVDEIKPVIEEHANRLLRECARGRWAVEVECKRNGEEDGRESFEVWVYDHEQGKKWKNGRSLSPGESGIVGEAIAGAVAMFACSKAPHVRPTIVRDEVAVHVDKIDVGTWMKMLRKEAELMDASGVLVVSHDRNVITACDTVLHVSNGAVKELEREVRNG